MNIRIIGQAGFKAEVFVSLVGLRDIPHNEADNREDPPVVCWISEAAAPSRRGDWSRILWYRGLFSSECSISDLRRRGRSRNDRAVQEQILCQPDWL